MGWVSQLAESLEFEILRLSGLYLRAWFLEFRAWLVRVKRDRIPLVSLREEELHNEGRR